jgi:hypothetical protein
MTYYRVYGMGPDNHIQDVVETNCADDLQALDEATTLTARFCGVEVWDRSRMVGRFIQGKWQILPKTSEVN